MAAELADSLRKDVATVSIEDGPWGREVVGTGARRGAVHRGRRLSLDDPMRCQRAAGEIDALTDEARKALADTVVRRGETPLPVRTPLPVELPEPMACAAA